MIEFGTAGIRGPVPAYLDHHTAIAVGRAIGSVLETSERSAMLGRDARTTGAPLSMGIAAGLTAVGIDCALAGRTATPVLARASREGVGVMVTASHNPPPDNGIKVFRNGNELRPAAEEAIESAIAEDTSEPASWEANGTCRSVNPLPEYAADLRTYLRSFADDLGFDTAQPLADTRIAVDGGNGVAVEPLARTLGPLGATLCVLNANPDGTAPARPSKPTPGTLEGFAHWIGRLVDPVGFGIAFDGDGDRLVLLDEAGSFVHEDTVVAVLARELVRRAAVDRPVVVTTPNASARIDDAVVAEGGAIERAPLGRLGSGIDRVEERAQADERVVFAAEPWKHLVPEFGPWIDAIASASLLALCVRSSGSIARLVDGIADPPYEKRAIGCPEEAKATVMDRLEEELIAAFPEGHVEATPDGYKVSFDRFEWVLIRPSGTERRIRVYAEGERAVADRFATVFALLESLIDERRIDPEG